jgi:hypothetical protein
MASKSRKFLFLMMKLLNLRRININTWCEVIAEEEIASKLFTSEYNMHIMGVF